MPEYDVFISYRREGGDMLATLLYTRLKADGYSPFFDVEGLRNGPFNEQLYDRIAECQDFILVLPPHGLDRCVNEGDWVRQEIARALELKKNIVPVLMNGFKFPDNLPADIAEVELHNGIGASSEYFDAAYARLRRLLLSTPQPQAAAEQNENADPFTRLLNDAYNAMIESREALRAGDQARINAGLASVQQVMQQFFIYAERMRFTDIVRAKNARHITSEFNLFAEDFNSFGSFPPATRMGPEAQQFAAKAENRYNALLRYIIKLLSETDNA